MNAIRSLIVITTLLPALPSAAAYQVHEWGTFTSMVGSNGKTINGMYHEDEALPEFVHTFGEFAAPASIPRPSPGPGNTNPRPCRSKACLSDVMLNTNIITQKMETPVIYFYSDHALDVDVNVKFPQGILTETYPAPYRTFPTRNDPPRISSGDTSFHVKVLAEKTGNIPFVKSSNIYSHARDVDSNVISTGVEQEKFLFYRGLGRFQPEIEIRSKAGALSFQAPVGALPQAAMLVYVNALGRSSMLDLKTFGPGEVKAVTANQVACLKSLNSRCSGTEIGNGQTIYARLAGSLVAAGLHHDEAIAMLETWKNGYLAVPGLRLLYILPRSEVDRVLPLTLSPRPEQLERVFVGRMELLLDTDENAVLENIKIAKGNFEIRNLGRFAEPILRRVREIYLASQVVGNSQQRGQPDLLPLIDKYLNQARQHIGAVNTVQ